MISGQKMAATAEQAARSVRFGIYQADLQAGELHKNGLRVNLQEQPFQVLTLLLRDAGKTVTREELQNRLWPAETFVDFDLGLNTAIRKLRAALGDSAENPRFIETLPKKGYRFICPVEALPATRQASRNIGENPSGQPAGIPTSFPESKAGQPPLRTSFDQTSFDQTWKARSQSYRVALALGMFAIVLLSVGFGIYRLQGKSQRPQVRNFAMESLEDRGTRIEAAYAAYLRGSDFLQADDLPEKDEKAAQSFAEAVQSDPSYAVAYAGLGEADWNLFQSTGNSKWQEQAQYNCNKALELDTGRPTPHLCVGVIHNGMGEYERAVQDFSQALAIDPRNTPAALGRARAYEGLGNIGEAKKDYLRAIDFNPGNWTSYSALARFYFGRGLYQEAARNYERAIEIKPDNSQPYFSLGAAYVEMGQTDKAIAALQEAVRLKPSFGAYENLGTVFLNGRRSEDSIRCFKKAVELDNNDYRGYGNLARAYFWAAGSRELARETYGKAIALANQKLTVNPEDPDINLNLAVYYAMLGQEDNSLYHLRRSKELQPATGETDFWAGVVNLQLGHKEKALAWLRQAIAFKYFAEINSVPELDSLRNDAEFRRILSGN